MRYRRAFIPGDSFFFTLATEKPCLLFQSVYADWGAGNRDFEEIGSE